MKTFELSFAGIPFVTDTAQRVPDPGDKDRPPIDLDKFQPCPDLVDELDRIIPFHYTYDLSYPYLYPGRNLGALAGRTTSRSNPVVQIRIGDWYYPIGACQWSVFRGLATSSQVKAMLAETGGIAPASFVMHSYPHVGQRAASSYRVTTDMYMLPARPLAEHGKQFDGLYLVTLVDERFYFGGNPSSLRVTRGTTWLNLIEQLATDLGIVLTLPTIDPSHGTPEPDSQLWTSLDESDVLMDAVCDNLGASLVRKLDGTYRILTYSESRNLTQTNRGSVTKVIRTAGGDIFASGTYLRAGDLMPARNSVVPETVNVAFPKYVIGNDPVPHFLNPRNTNPRPTSWFEDSYGDSYLVQIPVSSGGPLVSGLTGVGNFTVRSTAKALLSGEADASPANLADLTNLALRIARDRYEAQVAATLDEVYPGTLAWDTEGIHSIVWTYSTRSRQASTRVVRSEWTETVSDSQHATPSSDQEAWVKGAGGQSVAQTVRDTYGASGTLVGTATGGGQATFRTQLASPFLSGQMSCLFYDVSYLPTNNRWRGSVNDETILFEGTSGGGTYFNLVDVVYRGIDGSRETDHTSGSLLYQVLPNTTYGANLVTYGPGQFTYPKEWTSGGITGVKVAPQLQTVIVVDGSGSILNGQVHFSGVVESYDPSITSGPWILTDTVWVVDRNGGLYSESGITSGTLLSGQIQPQLLSGVRYGGQLVGYSLTRSGPYPHAAPVYATDVNAANPFLAQATAKDYTSTVFQGGEFFIRYWWNRVGDGDDPNPIIYSGTSMSGGPAGTTPAYHVQNLDVPTFPMTPFGTSGGGIQPLSIYRFYKGAGNYYLFDGSPFEDLFRRTLNSDDYGVIGYHRVYNQNTGLWMDGQEVRIILAS